MLRNHTIDQVNVKPVKISKQVAPFEIIDIIIQVFIPSQINRENLVLMFQLEDSHKELFGDAMVGIIDIAASKEELDMLDQSYINNSIINQSE